jgi:hypothetical protein
MGRINGLSRPRSCRARLSFANNPWQSGKSRRTHIDPYAVLLLVGVLPRAPSVRRNASHHPAPKDNIVRAAGGARMLGAGEQRLRCSIVRQIFGRSGEGMLIFAAIVLIVLIVLTAPAAARWSRHHARVIGNLVMLVVGLDRLLSSYR